MIFQKAWRFATHDELPENVLDEFRYGKKDMAGFTRAKYEFPIVPLDIELSAETIQL